MHKRDCLAIKRGMATTTTRPEREEEERENEDEKGGVKTSAIINARAEEEEDLFSSSSVGTLLLGKNKAEARETIERWRGTANGGRKGGNPTSEKSFQNGEILYENYADLGFSVEFLRESVDCVHLYNETKTDFVPFRGGGKGGKGARRTPTTTTRTRRLLTSAAASSKESSSSPSEKKTKTSTSSSDTITNTNTTTNTKKKKGEKERQQKIKEYWKDRRKVACQENDPMCLDIMRTPMKSFDEMEEEEQELNALAPEFMDGDVVLGKVNDVPSFPVFKGEILNAPEETLNVVEFTFSWCRPCKKFAAKYDMFAEYYDKVRFFKVVGDSDPVLATTAKSMNVTSTPHFFLFRGGKMVGSFTGTNEDNFREELGFAMKDEEKP